MQSGTIVRVFIASPGDVNEEREEACRVIADWNAANSLSKAAILEPVRVETHSQAAQGAHPQDIISSQLLDRCDVLLAVFWTRLGTRTQKERSGTLQEIREFGDLKGRDRLMIFFCERELPNDVNTEQVELVREFKKELQDQGLYKVYRNCTEFSRLFRQQLDLAMNGILESDELRSLPSRATKVVTLLPESNTLLIGASHGERSRIFISRTRGGHEVSAGDVCYSVGNDARSEARWEAAVEQLLDVGLIEDPKGKREVMRVTKAGFESADQLWHLILLRTIKELNGENNYVPSKSLVESRFVGQTVTESFIKEKLEELSKLNQIEPVRSDMGIVAGRLTLSSLKTLRNHDRLEFSQPDSDGS